MALYVTEELQPVDRNGLSRTELLQQLERIVTSTHFRNSKRYPSFLRFIVERTVEENVEVLKERNLGTEVFGRPSDYDTNADPIVRVTAGEVRKRIAQYYQTPGHEHELRIDLPLGSYVPHFHPVPRAAGDAALSAGGEPVASAINEAAKPPAGESVQVEAGSGIASLATRTQAGLVPPLEDRAVVVPIASLPAAPVRRRWWNGKLLWRAALYIMALSGVGLATFLGGNAIRGRSRASGTNYFWQSFASSSSQALIVIGVHFIDSSGNGIPAQSRAASVLSENESALDSMQSSDMVPLSDIVSYSKLTDLLTRRSLGYATKGSVDTTLDELRPGPVILLGGFNNLWTMRLTSALRFRLVRLGPNVNAIQDSRDPAKTWSFDNLQPALSNSRDYAIAASYYDTTIEQHVVIAAGIGKNGTVAAVEFLTTEKDMKNWLEEEKLPPNKNIELVLETDVLDGQPGPPHVIAFSAW